MFALNRSRPLVYQPALTQTNGTDEMNATVPYLIYLPTASDALDGAVETFVPGMRTGYHDDFEKNYSTGLHAVLMQAADTAGNTNTSAACGPDTPIPHILQPHFLLPGC